MTHPTFQPGDLIEYLGVSLDENGKQIPGIPVCFEYKMKDPEPDGTPHLEVILVKPETRGVLLENKKIAGAPWWSEKGMMLLGEDGLAHSMVLTGKNGIVDPYQDGFAGWIEAGNKPETK